MLVQTLILLLIVSFLLHMRFLMGYVSTRRKSFIKWFFVTAGFDIIISIVLILLALLDPDQVRQINLKLTLWAGAGIISMAVVMVQATILSRILKRMKDPDNYHYNVFGKKVMHSSVVRPEDIVFFMGSIPFFLFTAAYFTSTLIRLLMGGTF